MNHTLKSLMVATSVAFLSPVFLVACTGGDATVEAAPMSPKAAAALAKKIQANPSGADKILKDAGTSREAFEALMYEIAQDPAASREYAAAMK